MTLSNLTQSQATLLLEKSRHKILMNVPSLLTEMTRNKSRKVQNRQKSIRHVSNYTLPSPVTCLMCRFEIISKDAREIEWSNEYIWDEVHIKLRGLWYQLIRKCIHIHTASLWAVLMERNIVKPWNYLYLALIWVMLPDVSTYTPLSSAVSLWGDS